MLRPIDIAPDLIDETGRPKADPAEPRPADNHEAEF
jgi:hypothetical protein